MKYVPTIDKKGLAAMSASFFAAIAAAFGKYDVVHFHGRFAGVKVVDLIRKSRHKVLVTVCTPGGLFLHSRWSKAQ